MIVDAASRLSKLFVMLATTLICLAIVEFFLWTFMPVHQSSILRAYQYDEELGIRLRPGIHLFESIDFQQEVRVNSLGTINFQNNFDGYETLVFTLGDSYTQGIGVPSDSSYPMQLDLALNVDSSGNYHKKYGVVNLALAGYGGEQSLLALKRWAGLIGQPKYILYLGCDNDYDDDIMFKTGYRHNHIVEGNPRWGIFVAPLQFLTNDLQTGIRLKMAIGQFRRNRLGAVTDDATNGPSIAEREKDALDRLTAYADQHGATLIISWADRTESYNWAKGWAADNSVRFADWRKAENSVVNTIPAMPTENSHSAKHHRSWVNRMIAEEFVRQMNVR